MFELAFAFSFTHAKCIKSVANISLSVDVLSSVVCSDTLFQLLVTLKNYFLNIYASVTSVTTLFTYNHAVLLNTVRDRQVISDCRGPETAMTTCVY